MSLLDDLENLLKQETTYDESFDQFIHGEQLQISTVTPEEQQIATAIPYEDFSEDFTVEPIEYVEEKDLGNTYTDRDAKKEKQRQSEINLISTLKEVENSVQAGFNGNVWKPHRSPEGGNDTIAFGHKLTDREKANGVLIDGQRIDVYKKGLTTEQAENLLKKDIKKHRDRVSKKVRGFNRLPKEYQDILVTIDFNVKGGVTETKWPKLLQGMRSGDEDIIRKEMITTYTDPKGLKYKLLSRANKVYTNLLPRNP